MRCDHFTAKKLASVFINVDMKQAFFSEFCNGASLSFVTDLANNIVSFCCFEIFKAQTGTGDIGLRKCNSKSGAALKTLGFISERVIADDPALVSRLM